MIEQWRDIPSYPDYQVSNTGQVRSKDRVIKAHSRAGERPLPGRIITQKIGNNCANVSLKNSEGYTSKSVRRLVWCAFSDEVIPSGVIVQNIDGNPRRNEFTNLMLQVPNPANADRNQRRRVRDRAIRGTDLVYPTMEDRIGCATIGNRLLRMAW